jgi:dTDP-4-dehydrorhamnose reductase
VSETASNLSVRPMIVGADGLLGQALSQRLEQLFPHTVSATEAELDITDRWRVEAEVQRLQPTVLINCAAMADVDGCERDPALARRVNAEGPSHLAQVCRGAGIRLVHFSTDYVFDGDKGSEYVESDPPNPVNEYGRSKLLGEMAVLETLVHVVVLRISFLFGPGRATLIDKLAARARANRDPMPIVDGWVTKPTHVGEIVRAVEQVLAADVSGVWHLAGRPAVSRFEFAREVLRLIGDDPGRVTRLAAEALNLPARRPAATPLDTTRFEARFGPVRRWTEWAAEHLAEAATGLSG